VQRAAHVRLLDGKPIGYCETFIPADLKIRFSPTELNTHPMLTLLERKGVDIGWGDQLVGATLADARFSRLLDVPVGAALVRVRLVVFDTQQHSSAARAGQAPDVQRVHHVAQMQVARGRGGEPCQRRHARIVPHGLGLLARPLGDAAPPVDAPSPPSGQLLRPASLPGVVCS
jgi:hypothetical protein